MDHGLTNIIIQSDHKIIVLGYWTMVIAVTTFAKPSTVQAQMFDKSFNSNYHSSIV